MRGGSSTTLARSEAGGGSGAGAASAGGGGCAAVSGARGSSPAPQPSASSASQSDRQRASSPHPAAVRARRRAAHEEAAERAQRVGVGRERDHVHAEAEQPALERVRLRPRGERVAFARAPRAGTQEQAAAGRLGVRERAACRRRAGSLRADRRSIPPRRRDGAPPPRATARARRPDASPASSVSSRRSESRNTMARRCTRSRSAVSTGVSAVVPAPAWPAPTSARSSRRLLRVAARGRHLAHEAAVEGPEPDAVAGRPGRGRQQRRRARGERGLAGPGRAEAHRRRHVHQQQQRLVALLAVVLHVRHAGAREGVPVDRAHVVAGHVGARLLELDAAAAEGAPVAADERAGDLAAAPHQRACVRRVRARWATGSKGEPTRSSGPARTMA